MAKKWDLILELEKTSKTPMPQRIATSLIQEIVRSRLRKRSRDREGHRSTSDGIPWILKKAIGPA